MTTAIVRTETNTDEASTALVPVTYALDKNPAAVYLASLSESSRRTMREALDTIAKRITGGACDAFTLQWGNLRYQHTTAIRTALAERYSASTANRHIAALRGVLKDAWRLGYLSAEEYQRAIDIKLVRGDKASQAESGRALKSGEIGALMAACADGTDAGTRDAAMIAVAYACGLRRSEIVHLQVGDYVTDEDETGTLTVRHGKGNKERVVPVEIGTAGALSDWLHVRGSVDGALFTAIRKGDKVTTRQLTDQAIYYIFAERAEQAKVKSFSPHDFRRTFAGDLLDAGADISTVQKLMGHSNANTTAGYDRRDAKSKRAAVSKLHVPYQRRFSGAIAR